MEDYRLNYVRNLYFCNFSGHYYLIKNTEESQLNEKEIMKALKKTLKGIQSDFASK